MTDPRISADDRALLTATKAFASPSTLHSLWSLTSTLAVFAATLAAVRAAGPGWSLLLIPLLALLHVRIFVLQHDLGHRSFFGSKVANDVVGRLLSIFTGIAHDAWRVEHDWHHQVTGRMDRRGIDAFNSPMTVDEARANPVRAAGFQTKVRFWNIGVLGMLALFAERRFKKGFFVFRKDFIWKFDRRNVVASIALANAMQLLWHTALIALFGPLVWATVVLPAVVIAGMIGAWLFWVQHNFEHAAIVPGERWSFVAAAVDGSSYLRIPRPLRWFSGDIGIHHVHHLNSHIPCYRLDDARRAIPRLAAVVPLTVDDMRRGFTHHFYDPALGRRVPYSALSSSTSTSTAPSTEPEATAVAA